MSKRHNRKLELALFNHLYEFVPGKNRMVCAYCGDVREGVDHCPPISYVAFVGTKTLRDKGVKLFTFPCCATCNNTLGNKQLLTYEDRLVFLYYRLLGKSDRKVHWSNDDISELSGELKRMITAKQLHLRREITQRLRGMEENLAQLQHKG